ncbi:MAG: hypothetical protein LBU62_06055 [Bacteroidales bacterium]|jgi:hypothetical protein|nr:hypothetical protein [Bacteroidales bacterium]
MKTINVKKVFIGLVFASMIFVGCKNQMKGTAYLNDSAKKEAMFFSTETAGVLEFVDGNNVDILFPYAIDTKNTNSNISISKELWIHGEYEQSGNTITIQFKLSETQKEPAILELEIKNDGKILVGKDGGSFAKIDNK